MSRLRDELHRAAQDFADRVVALVEEEIRTAVREEVAAALRERGALVPATAGADPGAPHPAPALAATPAAPLTNPDDDRMDVVTPEIAAGVARDAIGNASPMLDRVTAFVRAHPGCRLSAIRAAVGSAGSGVSRALLEARQAGAIRMEGTRIMARYFAADAAIAPAGDVAVEPPAAAAMPAVSEVPPDISPPPPLRRATAPARASELLEEVDAALASNDHPIRLGMLLQAIVAEIRGLQRQVDPDDPVAPQLDRAMRRITAVRAERNLAFIVGLKRGVEADWAEVARRARARVAEFDRDADEVPPARRVPAPPSSKVTVVEHAPEDDASAKDAFPELRKVAAVHPLVLVGGIRKNEVLEQLERRYGLRAEWTAVQGANATALHAFLNRVRRRRVAAVVVLEGLFGTTQVQSVIAALKAATIPFAYGDRAGTESLRRALAQIDDALVGRAEQSST